MQRRTLDGSCFFEQSTKHWFYAGTGATLVLVLLLPYAMLFHQLLLLLLDPFLAAPPSRA
jgi:hypothetical protein